MKTIYVNLDDINGVLERVWDTCQSKACYFRAYPASGTIKFHSTKDDSVIAVVNVVDITDSYDIANALFENINY